MIYFTADTHFFHGGIIEMCGRPFEDVGDMNRVLIDNWNACVSGRDEIYFLGDFAFKVGPDEAAGILRKLNGKKYMIRGNHDDKYLKDSAFASMFEWVEDYHVMSYKDARFVLFHYPILEWAHYYRQSAHLYGHVHNSPARSAEEAARFAVLGSRAVNVGVDANNFYPVSADEIYARAFPS